METILRSSQYRRLFYLCSTFLLAVLLLTRYELVPRWDPNLSGNGAKFVAQLTDELTTSLFATILVGSFLFIVTPPVMTVAIVEPIDPKAINGLLKAASAVSTSWTLHGAMGRYTRAETLPALVMQARTSGVRRRLRLMLLDPSNTSACGTYATYRNGVKSSSVAKSPFTAETVKDEILCTILTATTVCLSESMVEIDIYLLPMWPVVRIDLTDEYAILTTEDPREPGLRLDRESHFYGLYTRSGLINV